MGNGADFVWGEGENGKRSVVLSRTLAGENVTVRPGGVDPIQWRSRRLGLVGGSSNSQRGGWN